MEAKSDSNANLRGNTGNETPLLDLVFCCDCTSSMSSYIETAKQNIRKISEDIHATEKRDVQYGLVCYRDHPPQDNTYATKVFPLTPSIKEMQANINTMSAHGGGDGPESVACALFEALSLNWRKNSVRVCVIIADAPPHGIGENSDGFPNGCPCGHDPLAVARKMAEQGIVIYAVACEPALGNYLHGRAFYKGLTEITSGRYLELGKAHLLPQVIVGGSAEEVDLKKYEEEIVKETLKCKEEAPELAPDDLQNRVTERLASKGLKTWQLNITHQNPIREDHYMAFTNSPSLDVARNSTPKDVSRATQPSVRAPRRAAAPAPAPAPAPASTGFLSYFTGSTSPAPPTSEASMSSFRPSSYESQSCEYSNSSISAMQVQKVMKRNNLF